MKAIMLIVLLVLSSGLAATDLNLRTNPGYMIVGALNLELDIGFGSRWSAGPSVTANAVLDEFIFGARLHRYRQPRRENGWYTGLAVRHSPDGLGFTDTFTSVRVLEHYQWHGEHFNLALGLGPDVRRTDDEDWRLWIGTDLSLGWRF